MSRSKTGSLPERKTISTRFGDIAYLETGSGPPAVFIHGLFLNADLWQHQLDALASLRRCLAPDLLAHGSSAVPPDGQLTISLQADMVIEFLNALGLESVDLVGNDSGGAIAQIIAAKMPGRLRTLTLTNCDTHDNWPPAAFAPVHDLADQGLLAGSLAALAADPAAARHVLAASFEHPGKIPDDTIRSFFGPFGSSPERAAAVQNYVAGMDNSVTVAIRDDLTRLLTPTLIVWGAADTFFDVAWARWLATTIPGTVGCVEIPQGRLFHPFERPEVLNQQLTQLWVTGGITDGSSH
jgi:pimeloyl-ACP methyl ester carboxylesterase